MWRICEGGFTIREYKASGPGRGAEPYLCIHWFVTVISQHFSSHNHTLLPRGLLCSWSGINRYAWTVCVYIYLYTNVQFVYYIDVWVSNGSSSGSGRLGILFHHLSHGHVGGTSVLHCSGMVLSLRQWGRKVSFTLFTQEMWIILEIFYLCRFLLGAKMHWKQILCECVCALFCFWFGVNFLLCVHFLLCVCVCYEMTSCRVSHSFLSNCNTDCNIHNFNFCVCPQVPNGEGHVV